MKKFMLVCLAMALISALIYVLLGTGVMHAGDLTSGDGIPAFFYIIPGGYIIGGVLILLKKRWLWITGAAINAFTIVVFYTAYSARPDIMLSAPGLITKIAQVLLEIGLIYMIVKSKPKEATVNIK
jgi:hypothetical protein